MDLYLIPDNLENTTLMSANGVAHYRVTTMGSSEGSVTYLQRPSETLEAGLLAELRSGKGHKTTIVRSTLLRDMEQNRGNRQGGMDASKFLYRKKRFNATSRYFLGNDGAEYCWRYEKSVGWTLSKCDTGDEITQQIRWTAEEGMFAGQENSVLRIYPCMVDIELIVLSFIMAEKKRRSRSKSKERYGVEEEPEVLRMDEDPVDGGGEDGGLTSYGEM